MNKPVSGQNVLLYVGHLTSPPHTLLSPPTTQVDFDEFYHWYTQGSSDPESPVGKEAGGIPLTKQEAAMLEMDDAKVGITYKSFTGFSN